MRIAIVTNDFPAPSETFISNKVLQFAAKGHKVIVFCSNFNTATWAKVNSGNYNVAIEPINRKTLLKHFISHPALWPLLFTNSGDKAKRLSAKFFETKVNKCAPDVIHFEFSGIGIHYLDAFKNIAGKKIVSCRGSAEKVKLLSDNSRKEKTRQLFAQVDAIHCVSDDMRNTVLPYCDSPEKIFINYPSINASLYKRGQPFNFHAPLNILSIGRLTFQKGYLTGLLALNLLKKRGVDFAWTIVGDGQQKEEIIFHINQLGLQQNVTLTGTKSGPEITGFYNQCDIFFLPSVYEGIANVALEAMSMELPIVATRSGGMDEVITHGVNGMLADVYDSERLAEYLEQLATTPMLCLSVGINARKRILEKFTIDTQIQKFEIVYSGLINSTGVNAY